MIGKRDGLVRRGLGREKDWEDGDLEERRIGKMKIFGKRGGFV